MDLKDFICIVSKTVKLSQDKSLALRYLLVMAAELMVQVVDLVVRKHLLDEITNLNKVVRDGDVSRRLHVIKNLDNEDDVEVRTVKKVYKVVKRSDFRDWMMQNGLF